MVTSKESFKSPGVPPAMPWAAHSEHGVHEGGPFRKPEAHTPKRPPAKLGRLAGGAALM